MNKRKRSAFPGVDPLPPRAERFPESSPRSARRYPTRVILTWAVLNPLCSRTRHVLSMCHQAPSPDCRRMTTNWLHTSGESQSHASMIAIRLAEFSSIGQTPIRRLLSRDNTLPITTFDNFFRCARVGTLHPRLVASDASLFSFRWCPAMLAPHQTPIRIKALGVSPRRPDVCPWHGSCPRKPSGPCRVQPYRAYKCHGSLVGPLSLWLTAEASPDATSTSVGQLSGVEARTNQSHGCEPFFLPASHPNPTGGSTAAKSSLHLKRHQVSQHIKARPGQCVGHRFARHPQMALGRLALGKSL
jgi:hypothetical protein